MLALGIALLAAVIVLVMDDTVAGALAAFGVAAIILTLFIGIAAPEHYTYRPIDGKIETKMVNGEQVHSFKSRGEEFQFDTDSISVETGPANSLRFTQIEDISNWLSFMPTKRSNQEPTLILTP